MTNTELDFDGFGQSAFCVLWCDAFMMFGTGCIFGQSQLHIMVGFQRLSSVLQCNSGDLDSSKASTSWALYNVGAYAQPGCPLLPLSDFCRDQEQNTRHVQCTTNVKNRYDGDRQLRRSQSIFENLELSLHESVEAESVRPNRGHQILHPIKTPLNVTSNHG